jgi:hypothetical protein
LKGELERQMQAEDCEANLLYTQVNLRLGVDGDLNSGFSCGTVEVDVATVFLQGSNAIGIPNEPDPNLWKFGG